MKIRKVNLKVDGLSLPCEIYLPKKRKHPHPTLCLCHGIPTAKHDPAERGYAVLAERFCAIGLVTLVFNFRGTGLAEGNMDMLGWTRDLNAAIDFLYRLDEVDKSKVCLLGSSAGAAVSVYVAANDPRISSVVTLACPAEFSFLSTLSTEQTVASLIDHFRSIGTIRDADFPPSVDEWLEGFSRISPIRWVDKISPRPLLLVHGDQDDVVALEHARKLYEKAKEPKEIFIIPGAGHRLRQEERAITTALSWLKAHQIDPRLRKDV